MKRIITLLSLFFVTCAAMAQTEIKVEDAAKHEGDSVTICTRIFGSKFFENSGRTLLNAGAKYPESPLTIMIPGDSRAAFKNKPEEYYTDKFVCVKGKIIMYKGKPEIIVSEEKDILVKEP